MHRAQEIRSFLIQLKKVERFVVRMEKELEDKPALLASQEEARKGIVSAISAISGWEMSRLGCPAGNPKSSPLTLVAFNPPLPGKDLVSGWKLSRVARPPRRLRSGTLPR